MPEPILKNFVIVPRKVASDYRNGLLSRSELFIYLWLRINANPYGIASISFENIADDVLGSSKKKNNANRLLLSLKEKRFIYYEQRAGRRGSFEVHFGDWPLPRENKSDSLKVKNLDKYFTDESEFRDEDNIYSPAITEEVVELDGENQRFESVKDDISQLVNAFSINQSFRGSYTDTETEKETETNRSRSIKNKIPLENFTPSTHEEEQCLAIARKLGEENMSFMLGSLKKHGWHLIEKAWNECKDSKALQDANNPGAFFNSVLQRLVTDYQGESQRI